MTTTKLDDFTKAYIEAMLWSSTAAECMECDYHGSDNDGVTCSKCGAPLVDQSFDQLEYDVPDLAPETLERIIADCEKFQADNCLALPVYEAAREHGKWSGAALAGHDFWLTRTGHGTGFWDRFSRHKEDEKPLAKIGDRLTKASKAAGNLDLYVGDDGKLYLS